MKHIEEITMENCTSLKEAVFEEINDLINYISDKTYNIINYLI